MTDQLQSLLLRLQQDGVDKGREQADELLTQARAEAARIVAAANAEAQQALERSKAEAARLEQRAQAAVKQAARDLLLSIGQRIEVLVGKLVGERVAEVMDGPTVVALLQRLIEAFVDRGRVNGGLDVVVGPELKRALTDTTLQHLRQRLEHGLTLHVGAGLGHGFQVRMGQGGVTHDLTEKAIAAAVAELVTPEIAQLVLECALDATPAVARA